MAEINLSLFQARILLLVGCCGILYFLSQYREMHAGDKTFLFAIRCNVSKAANMLLSTTASYDSVRHDAGRYRFVIVLRQLTSVRQVGGRTYFQHPKTEELGVRQP